MTQTKYSQEIKEKIAEIKKDLESGEPFHILVMDQY